MFDGFDRNKRSCFIAIYILIKYVSMDGNPQSSLHLGSEMSLPLLSTSLKSPQDYSIL